MFFALVALVTTLAAIRMGSALRLPAAYVALPSIAPVVERSDAPRAATPTAVTNPTARGVAGPAANARAAAVAEVLTSTVHREQRPGQSGGRASAPPRGKARPRRGRAA